VSLSASQHRSVLAGPPCRRGLVLALSVVAVMVTACGATAASVITTTTSASTSTTTVPPPVGGFVAPEVKFGTAQVGQPDPTTTVPVERGTRHINVANDAGQEVIIAQGGYLVPEWLLAEVTLPVTWTNLSGEPQQIVFDDAPVHSAVLAPGATFTWKSPGFAIGLTYHTAHGHHARLTLQNPNTP